MIITITDQAAEELRKLLESKNASETAGLRLAVTKGGCAGWQYEMRIAEPEDGDHVSSFEGGNLIVAADSFDKLDGCEVDYIDSLSDSGFRINNPHAARSCGCGTSFEAAGEAPPEPSELEDCGKS